MTRIICILYDEQLRTHDRCQAWQTKLGSCHPRHKNYTSTKLIEAIRDNDQESRKELFLWLFERAGKSNPNNT